MARILRPERGPRATATRLAPGTSRRPHVQAGGSGVWGGASAEGVEGEPERRERRLRRRAALADSRIVRVGWWRRVRTERISRGRERARRAERAARGGRGRERGEERVSRARVRRERREDRLSERRSVVVEGENRVKRRRDSARARRERAWVRR